MAKIDLENQPSKSKLDLSNESKNADMTWDGSDPMTWDDMDSTWSAPALSLQNVAKSLVDLSNDSK